MIAVVLLCFGGPEKLEDISSFIENVTGRALPPDRIAIAVEKYRLIGGRSPFCSISRDQAAGLQRKFGNLGSYLKVYLGMKFWKPTIATAIKGALADNPEKIVLLCLTPYYSAASVGEYLGAAQKELSACGNKVPVIEVTEWNEEPALVDGLARLLGEAGTDVTSGTAVLFSAHSLLQNMIEDGKSYTRQVNRTAELTAEAAGIPDWRLAWQSEGRSGGDWLKPTAGEALIEIKDAGYKAVLIDPIGFIADNVETLYDIDIEMKETATKLGLRFRRVDCLNAEPEAIEAMASALTKALA